MLGNGGWTFNTKLLVPDDVFFAPTALAFDGETLVVGSSASDAPSSFEAGAAYVFRLNGGQWSGPVTLAAGDATTGAQFGNAVGVSGDLIAVSANLGPGATSQSGAAYIFAGNDAGVWSQKAKLVAADGLDFDSFGQNIAMSGQTVSVGATGHSLAAANVPFAGAAYIFRPSDEGVWRQIAEVFASGAISGGFFGDSMALQNNTLVVGADGQHPPVAGYPGGRGVRLSPESISWNGNSPAFSCWGKDAGEPVDQRPQP